MVHNKELQQFVDQMATQARVLNSFDMHMEIEHGMIVVRHPWTEGVYIHVAGVDSIAIGALGWLFSSSIHDIHGCCSILEALRSVVVFEEDER